MYAETRMKHLAGSIDPIFAPHRIYEIEHRSGVLPLVMASGETILRDRRVQSVSLPCGKVLFKAERVVRVDLA